MAKTAKNKKRIEKFKRFLKRNITPTWAKRFAYQVVAFLVSVSMLVMVVSYAFNKTFDEHDLKFVDGFTITAHTGAYNTPDNSMESLEKAIEHGDASFEIEVRQRPNGTIVMSNDIINTKSGGTEITAAFQRVKKTDMHLNLDIRETRVLKNLHDLIVDYSLTDRVTLTGIEVFQANKVKENCPGVEYYVNYMPSRINIFTEDYQQKIIDMLEIENFIQGGYSRHHEPCRICCTKTATSSQFGQLTGSTKSSVPSSTPPTTSQPTTRKRFSTSSKNGENKKPRIFLAFLFY